MSQQSSVTAQEVTGRFSNSKVLLLCLRYATCKNHKPHISEVFSDSLNIQGRVTGHAIENSILAFQQRNNTDILNWRAQVYRSATTISGEASLSVSEIRREQQLAEYPYCGDHILSSVIFFPCKSQLIQKVMHNLTTLCVYFLRIHLKYKDILKILSNLTK